MTMCALGQQPVMPLSLNSCNHVLHRMCITIQQSITRRGVQAPTLVFHSADPHRTLDRCDRETSRENCNLSRVERNHLGNSVGRQSRLVLRSLVSPERGRIHRLHTFKTDDSRDPSTDPVLLQSVTVPRTGCSPSCHNPNRYYYVLARDNPAAANLKLQNAKTRPDRHAQ